MVTFRVSVLEQWSEQVISIFVIENGEPEKIFSKLYKENQQETVQFELKIGVYVEVYFNDELAFKQEIKDPILENINPQDNNERLVPKISYIHNVNEPLMTLKP